MKRFQSTVSALEVLTRERAEKNSGRPESVSVFQSGLKFQVDLKSTCEQKLFQGRNETHGEKQTTLLYAKYMMNWFHLDIDLTNACICTIF